MQNKIDTAIRAEGAELYVQAVLMLQRGLVASLASRNMPGYDVLATNPDNARSCRIQVKYRKAVNADGMRVKSFDFDFIAYVAGNLGRLGKHVRNAVSGPPQVFILPKSKVRRGLLAHDLYLSPTRGRHERYLEAWHLIDQFLSVKRPKV